MHPQGACLGLGQGFRNAPQEIPVKARAGLEECSSRELRVEAVWGRAWRMFPQSTPLTLGQKWRGFVGGELFFDNPPTPHPIPPAPGWLRIRFPCGDQHPANRALGCPGEETGGWRHSYSTGLSKNISKTLYLIVSGLSVLPRIVKILHKVRKTLFEVGLLFFLGTTRSFTRNEIAGQPASEPAHQRNTFVSVSFPHVYKMAHTVNKNNTSHSDFISKDCIFTYSQPVTTSFLFLWWYLN